MDAWVFYNCSGFQWDSGNDEKNREKHGVEPGECEEAFFNRPFIVAEDVRHSLFESRYFALGKSNVGRHLFIVFTLRGELVRVISVRDMSRKERKIYEEAASRSADA